MPVFFASESVLRNHQGTLGYPDNSQYVMVESEAFELLEKCDYNFRAVCNQLGVPERWWAEQKIYLIKIESDKAQNLRMPSEMRRVRTKIGFLLAIIRMALVRPLLIR